MNKLQKPIGQRGYLLSLLIWTVSAGASTDVIDGYLFSDMVGLSRANLELVQTANDARSNWLDRPELRISPEQDANSENSQSYALRFRPKFSKELAAERALRHVEAEIIGVELQQSVANTLHDRYNQLIDLAAAEVDLKLARQRVLLGEAVMASLSALSSTRNFNSARLQEASLDLETERFNAKHRSNALQAVRQRTVGTALEPDNVKQPRLSTRLTSVAQIVELVRTAPTKQSELRTSSSQRALAVKKAQHELTLENTQTGFGLDLVELSYEDKTTDSYNFTLGFRLPQRRTSGQFKRVTALMKAEQQAFIAETQLAVQLDTLVSSIHSTADYYRGAAARLAQDTSRFSIQTAQNFEPATAALLREFELKQLEELAQTHSTLLRQFINYLDLTAQLSNDSQINWLTGA